MGRENISDGIQIRLVDEAIPPGMRRRRFVVAGCGDPTCDACYEPIPMPSGHAAGLLEEWSAARKALKSP